MNNIEIENLSLEELVKLHSKIVRRMRELPRAKVYEKLPGFQIGDQISFEHEGNRITGTVIRVNRKSLSVRTGQGSWYVDPRRATKILLALKRE